MSKEKIYLIYWGTYAHGTYKVKAENVNSALDKLSDDMMKLNETKNLSPNLVVNFLDPDEIDVTDEDSISIITDDGKEINWRDTAEAN